MSNDSQQLTDALLYDYASKHSDEAKAKDTDKLLAITDTDQLFTMLASRVSFPDAMFRTPGDRYGTQINEGELTRSGPMIELGQVCLRQMFRSAPRLSLQARGAGQAVAR